MSTSVFAGCQYVHRRALDRSAATLTSVTLSKEAASQKPSLVYTASLPIISIYYIDVLCCSHPTLNRGGLETVTRQPLHSTGRETACCGGQAVAPRMW